MKEITRYYYTTYNYADCDKLADYRASNGDALPPNQAVVLASSIDAFQAANAKLVAALKIAGYDLIAAGLHREAMAVAVAIKEAE